MPPVTYQVIQWANFTQTFASAVASRTNPAVSSGGGTQVFQFEDQGGISYVDEMYDTWKANGLYDDFLPGLIDTLKVEKGYAAIPYNLDMRVIWANKTLLDEAGAKVPTDWQSYLDAAAALKKNNVYGYGTGAGAGAYTGQHALVCWMINNGGGLFDEQKQPNCVTPENIEAVNFVLEMVSKGYVDPASATYTSDNVETQWKAKKFGTRLRHGRSGGQCRWGRGEGPGGHQPTHLTLGEEGRPLLPEQHHDLQEQSEHQGHRGFPHLLLPEHGAALDREHRHRTAAAQVDQRDPGVPEPTRTRSRSSRSGSPLPRRGPLRAGEANFLNVTTVDATPAMNVFTQSILGGSTDATAALTKLQDELKANMKS